MPRERREGRPQLLRARPDRWPLQKDLPQTGVGLVEIYNLQERTTADRLANQRYPNGAAAGDVHAVAETRFHDDHWR
jgi:hypothetical protein